jgi:hypothetical protein
LYIGVAGERVAFGVGHSETIFNACGLNRLVGIVLLAKGVRPTPVAWLPVVGS